MREQANVHHERHDHAEFDFAVHGQHRADHAHDHVTEVADEVHERHHQAGEELALPAGDVQIIVVFLELFDGVLFAAVCLDHGVACVHFLNVSVHISQRDLLSGEVLLRGDHDHAHDHQAKQRGTDGAQRHDHVVVEHHDERADEQRDRSDQRSDRLAERLADRVHIVGDAAEHIAVADLVEVFERQAINLLADRLTQLLRGALRNVGHQPALQVAQQRVPNIQRDKQPCDVRDGIHIDRVHDRPAMHHGRQPLRDLVGHVFELVRSDNLADRAGRTQNQGENHHRNVVTAEFRQFAHHTAEILRLFHGSARASHWSSCHVGPPLQRFNSSSLNCDSAICRYTSQLSSSSWCVP